MAKEKLNQTIQIQGWDNNRPQHLPMEVIEIYWNDRQLRQEKISSSLQKTLTNRIQTKQIRKYWVRKSKFSAHTESYIDWISSKKSRLGLQRSRQKWLSKWLTGFCGVGVMLQLYNYQKHTKCPRCKEDGENTDHVLRCLQIEAQGLWQQSLHNLETWMTTNKGHPELIELIILGLQRWHNNDRIPLSYDILEPLLLTAWRKQRRLSWKSFIEGFGAKEWRECQTQYLLQIGSQKSGLLWVSQVQ
jgi:hypothetical protein